MSNHQHTNLSLLSDAELIRHVDNGLDKLTSTDLEIELLARFESHSETLRDLSPVLEYIDAEALNAESIAADLIFAKQIRDLLAEHNHKDIDDLQISLEALAEIAANVKTTKFSTPNT
jgi:hypothetical protein